MKNAFTLHQEISVLRQVIQYSVLAAVLVSIFILDSTTHYEVAAAVFYAIVILTAARIMERQALILLGILCVILTVVSIIITPHGNYQAGLINTGISIAAILMTLYLVLKMTAAQKAAHLAQEQLLRLARTQSLEGLTTSLAHELNQPLTAVMASGSACKRWLSSAPPNVDKADAALSRILSNAERASLIIDRVRSLTKGDAPKRQIFDFNRALLDVLSFSESEIERHDIQFKLNLGLDLPAVYADSVQLQQVMGNLILNAIEATAAAPDQRMITIRTMLFEHYVQFSIFDTGIGLPENYAQSLFETFWTTKKNGIGIGLSISRGIVETNGGQIWAEPNRLGGAIFHFTTPVAPLTHPEQI